MDGNFELNFGESAATEFQLHKFDSCQEVGSKVNGQLGIQPCEIFIISYLFYKFVFC